MGAHLQRATSVVLLALATAAGAAFACKCATTSPFLALVGGAELVLVAQVTKHTAEAGEGPATAMEVQVRDVLAGKELRRQVRVRGMAGNDCRPAVSEFPVGTSWVLALSPQRIVQGAPEYALHGCGQYWLRVEGEGVVGHISDERERRMTLLGLARQVRERQAPGGARPPRQMTPSSVGTNSRLVRGSGP